MDTTPFNENQSLRLHIDPQPAVISPLALVDPAAEIAVDVEIGPFCVVGPKAKIGRGTILHNNVTISGDVTIGEFNVISPNAVIGGYPQDLSYRGTETKVVIGDRNVIRECVTINRASEKEDGYTRVGDDCYFMGNVHIAHDCVVGNNTIFANNATLAGHVTVHDYAILGGFTLVHQFCHVGVHSFTGMGTSLGKDLPPYVMATGAPGVPRGINNEGLKRHGYSSDERANIKKAYKKLYLKNLTLSDAIAELENVEDSHTKLMAEFCQRSQAGRGIIR